MYHQNFSLQYHRLILTMVNSHIVIIIDKNIVASQNHHAYIIFLLRNKLVIQKEVDFTVIAALDEVAYLLNLRQCLLHSFCIYSSSYFSEARTSHTILCSTDTYSSTSTERIKS